MQKLMASICDEKGRLYLSQEVRKRYGKRFVVVEVPGEIILVPVPEDPIKELEEIGKKLRGKSIEQLKESIAKQAAEELAR